MTKIYAGLFLLFATVSAKSQNPFLLKDIYPGATGSGIQEIVKTSGFTFFNALDGSSADRGLYRTDGTTAGTIKLNLTYPTYISTKADKLTALGNKVVFAGDNFSRYGEIWSSDGTQAGTIALERYQPTISTTRPVISDVIKLNNEVIYSVRNTDNHLLLKKTNGTVGSLEVVHDFGTYPTGNAQVTLFNIINNFLYFIVYDGADNDQLWRSDGTAGGTFMLYDFGPSQYVAGGLMPAGSNFYVMIVTPGIGNVLWKSDGTVAGTAALKTIGTTGNNNYPSNTAIGNTLYFAGLDGNGKELWKTDGTGGGTVLVADINSGAGSSNPSNFTVLNNNLYFAASDGTGNKLWKYDGTAATLVKDINPSGQTSVQSSFVVSNNNIILSANTAVGGTELWITDGTTANTMQVADINPGTANSSPAFLTPGNPIYFSANNGVNGAEIFKYNNNGDVIQANRSFYVNDNSTTGDVFTLAVGNNANNGSKAFPFATPDYAYSIAQAGDTIYVDAGSYDLGGLTYSFPKPITFRGANYTVSPNDPANKLLPNGGRNSETVITNGQINIASNDLSFEGFTLDLGGNRAGFVLQNSAGTNNDFGNF
ncbi:MAG: ELWxxDGT repeat protein, partial [Ferruginibacter sp.]